MRRHKAAVRLIAIPLATALTTSASWAVTVSGFSPFAGCSVGGPPGPNGVNYVNAEVEPWLAVNPAIPGNLIGVWQQDRWSNGGAHGLVAGFSFSDGQRWEEVALPFSACAGGTPAALQYERASDPWVSIGPDGTAYAVSISFNQSNNNNAVGAAVSRDGGRTWGDVNVLIANNEPTAQFFNDKESVTANPIRPGTAYAVWDRLELPNGNPYANMHTAAYRGPTFFAKTTNGGQSWSRPKIIVNVPSRQQTIGNQIVVNSQNGTLYDFFNLISPPLNITANKVAFIKSTDDGATWTKPQIIADLRTAGVTDPRDPNVSLRTGDIIPEPAIDPVTGQLYVVWQDSRFSAGRFDEIVLSTSTDGGNTWSTPIRVNTPKDRPAFNPSIRVNSVGTVGVTYYDFRDLQAGDSRLLTGIWLTRSINGGQSFGGEQRVAGPFDMKFAPDAEGLFVGDYQGLDVRRTAFLPFFVRANTDLSNRTDVFFAPPPSP